MAIVVVGFSSCKKNNQCSAWAEKAVVENYIGSDSCEIIFRLEESGDKIDPTNLSSFPSLTYGNGDLVWISWKKVSGTSLCGLGDVVKIKCVSDRPF